MASSRLDLPICLHQWDMVLLATGPFMISDIGVRDIMSHEQVGSLLSLLSCQIGTVPMQGVMQPAQPGHRAMAWHGC
jgi:hypothetical protein